MAPLIMLGFVFTPASAAGEVEVNVNSPEEVGTGDFFLCTVEIGKVTDLNAVQFDITYDSSILELESIGSGQMSDGASGNRGE